MKLPRSLLPTRAAVARSVNSFMTASYREIGRSIVEFEVKDVDAVSERTNECVRSEHRDVDDIDTLGQSLAPTS